MKTLFINASSRNTGNTNAFGERVLEGIPHDTLHLIDYQLNFERDQRDTGDPQLDTTDDYEALMTQFTAADDIVIGTPVYWYNMTGQLKVFMDRWFDSKTNGFPFAGKRLYLLVVGADEPETKATAITDSIKQSCDWLEMTFMGTATVTADGPTDVASMTDLPANAQALRQVLVMTVSRETPTLD